MIQFVFRDITIELEKKKIKNMYLKVLPPDGRVHISAPLKVRDSMIEKFVSEKYEWILKNQERLKSCLPQNDLQYLSGDTLFYWGKAYRLRILEADKDYGIQLSDNIIILMMPKYSTKDKREKQIISWYRNSLCIQLPALIEKWEKMIGVSINDWGIRDMKTRWGTCNVRDKKITFNLQLVKKPPQCLEYVVVHELVHLLEQSHNSIFKGYMDRFLPDWRMRKAILNEKL